MAHTDITPTSLIQKLPEKFRPYALLMRLDRPIGTWLLLLPSLWGIALAQAGQLNITATLSLFSLFTVGAVIMRGAGCAINDLWDIDIDRRVERTQSRPLAAGTLGKKQALLLIAFLLLFGLVILLQLPVAAIVTGMIALIPVVLYPLAKRVTWYPQAVLGLTFNIGTLMGWASITNDLTTAAPWLIYAGAFFWTLGYDTIYAHQDKTDDALIGVKSTALKFGVHSKLYIGLSYALAFALLAAAGYAGSSGWEYFAILTTAGIHFIWQLMAWKSENPASCLAIFRSNRDAGLIILLASLCS